MLKRFLTLAGLLGLTLHAAPARAQEHLSDILVTLIQSDIFLAEPPAGFINHSAHFVAGVDQQLAPYLFNQQLLAQLGTVPLGSSSGGFSYTLDPATGLFSRSTESFGPVFAERALTNGRGKVTFGGNFQYSNYSSFEGTSLKNGDLKFYLRHANTGGNFFEGDVIEAALDLKLSSSTFTMFSSYGVTDNWDIAVAVPLIHVSMDATVNATVLRFATGENSPIHTFPGGGSTQTLASVGSATGLGDILVRSKYRITEMNGGGLAANVDLRLPTGKEEHLLGAGAFAGTFTLIGSSVRGKLAPHFNVGFTAAGEGDLTSVPNELGYTFGTEYAASPRATLVADILGRSLLDANRLQYTDTTINYMSSTGVQGSSVLRELALSQGTLNLISLALGAKYNVSGNLLLAGNVLLSLTSSGVTSRVTPVFGLEYSY